MTYVNDAFNDAVITEPFHKLSANVYYYIPKDGPIYSYREFISMLPNIDNPDAFGQNPNADIASQIRETRSFYLFTDFVSFSKIILRSGFKIYWCRWSASLAFAK